MKNIAILCNYSLNPNRIGGMDRFFRSFNASLIEKGNKVDWYFKNGEKFDFYSNLNITIVKKELVEQGFIYNSKKNNLNYDIIITHFLELCTPYYKQFKQFHKNAFIVAVDHNPRPIQGFPLKKRVKKRIASFLYSKYINQFIGVSQYTVDNILKDYGLSLKNKTTLVYNGIDTNVFIKRVKENHQRFIVASHLRESKGIQDLLRALSLINKEKLNNIIIDIYGEGPYENKLKELTQKYQLQNNVFFKGSSSELHTLFSKYSYMIQPTYMECFSLSILESLSANVPVITTTVGGNLEVVSDGKNGFIYKPGDSDFLAIILKQIINSKRVIDGDTSKLIHQKFYIKKMVNEHIKALNI
ncbi:glycosyltransferase family 4 protein [uncultured Polaribacter sp.]|uniref:glycosyltransferase family 4 protein n=1 Tax=uncultured Polaribacter sp. TaxID=174711 RepID=UPI0026224302|nr:glycosyltransferase family 4 protein [uncultured Polaribacter sp.]